MEGEGGGLHLAWTYARPDARVEDEGGAEVKDRPLWVGLQICAVNICVAFVKHKTSLNTSVNQNQNQNHLVGSMVPAPEGAEVNRPARLAKRKVL